MLFAAGQAHFAYMISLFWITAASYIDLGQKGSKAKRHSSGAPFLCAPGAAPLLVPEQRSFRSCISFDQEPRASVHPDLIKGTRREPPGKKLE